MIVLLTTSPGRPATPGKPGFPSVPGIPCHNEHTVILSKTYLVSSKQRLLLLGGTQDYSEWTRGQVSGASMESSLPPPPAVSPSLEQGFLMQLQSLLSTAPPSTSPKGEFCFFPPRYISLVISTLQLRGLKLEEEEGEVLSVDGSWYVGQSLIAPALVYQRTVGECQESDRLLSSMGKMQVSLGNDHAVCQRKMDKRRLRVLERADKE